MNRKLSRFAKKAQLLGVLLLLLAALRADGGLGFWLAPALTGMVLVSFGLGLAWLCGSSGLALQIPAAGELSVAHRHLGLLAPVSYTHLTLPTTSRV